MAILVYDISNKSSFESIQKWYDTVLEERGDDLILGLLGNKMDLEKRQVSTEEGFKKAEKMEAIF